MNPADGDEVVGDRQPATEGVGDGPQTTVASDGDMPATEPSVEPLVETIDAAELRSGEPPAPSEEPPVAPDVSDLPPAELRAAVEAVLFVATRPLTIERLQRVLPGTSEAYLEGFLTGLAARYERERRGWELRHIAGGWQLLTRRELYPWVRQLERRELPTKLSKSALETLAIVAYKQPITRGAIEDIRGVQCGPVLRQLMDLKLVQVTGRDEETLGRPLLYATTDVFLSRFGLGKVEDLPRRHEFGA
jgi:segregation and condensation protein B